jgi:hypothetical protein
MARALVRALRLESLRVLVLQAILESHEAADEQWLELGARVTGTVMPAALFGVLPTVSTGSGATLVGRALAVADRAALVERFGEDYYRNPQSGPWLRQQDLLPEGLGPLADGDLEAAVVTLGRQLEASC